MGIIDEVLAVLSSDHPRHSDFYIALEEIRWAVINGGIQFDPAVLLQTVRDLLSKIWLPNGTTEVEALEVEDGVCVQPQVPQFPRRTGPTDYRTLMAALEQLPSDEALAAAGDIAARFNPPSIISVRDHRGDLNLKMATPESLQRLLEFARTVSEASASEAKA